MSSRTSFRRKMVLPVTVIRHGGQETQLAHTLDLTETSARLGGLVTVLEAGEIIELRRGGVKAKFQVAWMGVPGGAMAGQAGVRGLDPERCIWNINLPDDDVDKTVNVERLRRSTPPVPNSSQLPDERRWHPRYTCSGKAAIRTAGVPFPINGEVKDISQGGVYIEVSAPLPVNTKVNMTLCVEDIQFETAAEVRTSYPLLGMGVSFQNLAPEDVERLAVAVERARRKTPVQQELTALAQDVTEELQAWDETSTFPEKNQTEILAKLCRYLVQNYDQWKPTVSAAQVDELKLAIHELAQKLSPATATGYIEYLDASVETSKTV